MDFRDIERVLPHRYPFLLVDRVTVIDDARIVAVKNVTRNEPHFNGHFPGHPVMPGVLIIAALAQAGALYAARLTKYAPARQDIYFMASIQSRTPADKTAPQATDAGTST